MTNDGHPNPTSPPTSDEETTSSSGDPPFWIDELPDRVPSLPRIPVRGSLREHVLSGDASRAKLRDEDRVPLLREAVPVLREPVPLLREAVLSGDASRAKLRDEGPQKTPNKMDEETPLQDEIDTMRCNLKHLIETFSTVETLKACPEIVEGNISSSPPPSTTPPPASPDWFAPSRSSATINPTHSISPYNGLST